MKITAPLLSAMLALTAIALPCSRVAAAADIYPAPEQAAADLSAALHTASAAHKRVIVDFGGNWCPDCHVLDLYFHDAANKAILDSGFVLVHVNVGTTRIDRNGDIAARCQIPLQKGVPALAVLDGDGKLLYSQASGEFEAMRHLKSSSVTQFLTQWKPSADQ